MKLKYSACALLGLMLLFNACDRNKVYEDFHDFDEGVWNMDSIPSFEFEVKETTPKKVLINVRNTIEFRYRNLYLTYYLTDSLDNELKSELVNVQLFDAITGKPLGEGNSVFQHEVQILPKYSFPYTGKFKLKIAQYMREADLKDVPSVGLRIEQLDK